MTSMLKRVDNAVQAYIDDFVDGSVKGGKDVINDLTTEGVGLATTGGFIDDIQDQIDDYRQKIIDGDIEVPTTVGDLRTRARCRRARVHRGRSDGGPGQLLPGPAVVSSASSLQGAGLPTRTPACDIMRRARNPCAPDERPVPGAGDDGRPRRPRREIEDVRRDLAAAPRGRGPPWPNRSPGRQRRAGPPPSERPVRGGAARHHQALPRRRGQPRHRAAGAAAARCTRSSARTAPASPP